MGLALRKTQEALAPAPSRHPRLAYRPEVDGLRAIAVLSVILYHAKFSRFAGGFVGVDIFFVISGYLITSILLWEIRAGTFSLVGFIERRVRRIFPALAVMLTVSTLAAYHLLEPMRLTRFCSSVVAVLGFSANLYFIRNHGYFEPDPDYFVLLHTWSLGVEEQFYLFLPMLLVFLSRRDSIRKFVLAGIGAFSFVLCIWASTRSEYSALNFYSLPTRAWELLLGSLVAFVPMHRVKLSRKYSRISRVLGGLGLVAVFYSVLRLDGDDPFPNWSALLPTLGTVALLLFESAKTPIGRVLSHPALVGIGLISYSAYLWHQPVFLFVRALNAGVLSRWQYGVLSLVALAVGFLSWRFVEKPFRNRERFSRAQIFGASAGIALALALTALSIRQSEGFTDRVRPVQEFFDSAVPATEMRKKCHLEDLAQSASYSGCKLFSERPAWASFGDSHVVEPANALAAKLGRHGQGIWHFSFSGCGVRSLLFEHRCSAVFRRSLNQILNDPYVKNVFLGFRYARDWHDTPLSRAEDYYTRWEKIENIESRRQSETAMRELIKRLGAAGKRIILMYPIAEYPDSITDALYSHRFSTKLDEALSIPREWVEARNAETIKFLDTLADGAGIVRLIPFDVFCDKTVCKRTFNGKSMYYDDDHLSPSGAARLIDALPEEFLLPKSK
ncbi:MAG: acyltransferase [Bdellovibrionales bacterium]|nr:acyltransferase [Bdellovibrionales bacterium]